MVREYIKLKKTRLSGGLSAEELVFAREMAVHGIMDRAVRIAYHDFRDKNKKTVGSRGRALLKIPEIKEKVEEFRARVMERLSNTLIERIEKEVVEAPSAVAWRYIDQALNVMGAKAPTKTEVDKREVKVSFPQRYEVSVEKPKELTAPIDAICTSETQEVPQPVDNIGEVIPKRETDNSTV